MMLSPGKAPGGGVEGGEGGDRGEKGRRRTAVQRAADKPGTGSREAGWALGAKCLRSLSFHQSVIRSFIHS